MKLTSGQLKEALEKLGSKSCKMSPRQEWLKENRSLLLSQIRNTINFSQIPAPKFSRVFDKIWGACAMFMPTQTVYGVVRPIVAVLAIVSITTSGWITSVKASQNSLPGDVLYNVKMASESAQIIFASVTAGDAAMASLRVERAVRRLDEARQLARTTSSRPDASKFVDQAVESARREIKTVHENLQRAREKNPEGVSAIAKAVDRDIKNITNELEGARADFDKKELTAEKARREVERLVLATETTAAEAMTESHLKGDKSVSIDDVKKRLGENLEKTLKEIKETEFTVSAPGLIHDDELTKDAVVKVKEGVLAAKQKVEEAKELLKEENLPAVLEKVGETKEIVTNIISDADVVTSTLKGNVNAPVLIIEN